MRIRASSVAMQSDRSYYAVERTNRASVSTNGSSAAILTFSAEARERSEHSGYTYVNGTSSADPQKMKEKRYGDSQTTRENTRSGVNAVQAVADRLQSNQAKAQAAGGAGSMQQTDQAQQTVSPNKQRQTEMKLQLLKMLIMSMRRIQQLRAKKGQPVDMSQIQRLEMQYARERKQAGWANRIAGQSAPSISTGSMVSGARAAAGSTVWHRTTVESAFVSEQEHTAYSAQGYVQTSDGRQIGFQVNVEMSRAFEAEYENYTEEEYVVTDPLVINLDADTADVTDWKFMFDINADGKEDEISFVSQGSGFLALDKNKDGVINDGSELFGTRSGDGFRDLAAYDTDKDGWLDEDDEVYDKLVVWTKDEKGNDKLLSLKEAGVGAIYLGSANTQFSLNSAETNQTNGVIRKTGVYLKENGQAGTVQHVDLVL